ncbi:MAG: type II/IV secretion system protein [Deltaproteobacteria bacterium]|nr:type II/IV secretion system protein [Deltaproteobacteria bacterium]
MSSPSLNLDWLLGVLEQRAYLHPEQSRMIRIRAGEQRARIARQLYTNTGDNAGSSVSAPEIIASFEFNDASDALLDLDRIASIIALEANLPYHKIDPLALDMKLVSGTLSRPFALRYAALPITKDATGITVAVENPFDYELIENLKRAIVGQVNIVVSSKRDILKAITEIYGFKNSVESAARESSSDSGLSDFEQLVQLRGLGEIEATDQHIVNAVDFLLRYAFDQRASDIHIEPKRGDSQVRLRIDGVLHNVHTIPRLVHPAIISRIKTMARLDIADKRRPQDGRIKTAFTDRAVELRVSTLPVAFGEKVVVRIFDPDSLLGDLSDLGFDASELTIFKHWLGEPHGLILVTGPTGSGKTTTLYTALKNLASDTVNVTSVEDPIEMVADQFNQVAVQPKIGIDFAQALRTLLRQDPDIIMVGEIRDSETAQMAIQAALTGHLVLSTLHTNDSVGAITRLLDLGVPPFLLSSSLVGVMAQRLLRRVCKDCRSKAPLTADQAAALGLNIQQLDRFSGTMSGAGCVNCRGTGYQGRIGIFEMLDASSEIKKLINQKANDETMRQTSVTTGTRELFLSSLERLAQGQTTTEEILRVLGMR